MWLGRAVRRGSSAKPPVGVHFRPGGASVVLGLAAGDLRDSHIGLDELSGAQAWRLRERLIAAPDPASVFAALQAELLAGLLAGRRPPPMHPAVLHTLRALHADPLGLRIAAACKATGYGPKRFTALFRDAVGLTPKLYQRIRRFDTVLDRAFDAPTPNWAELAADGGYVDQAHLHHEFINFTGLTPGAWRRARKEQRLHVCVDGRL
jgi:methylphosphotriester-DNA--protein-cysteine methyltransferase